MIRESSRNTVSDLKFEMYRCETGILASGKVYIQIGEELYLWNGKVTVKDGKVILGIDNV